MHRWKTPNIRPAAGVGRRFGGLLPVLLLVTWAGWASARTTAEPAGAALQADDASCVSLPRAPTLMRSDYLAVPSSHQAKAFPIGELRCLFDTAKPQTASLVKKSIAADFPVLAGWNPPAASAVGDGLWHAGRATARSAAARSGGCGSFIVVGYDDAKFGGAFDVMQSCGTKPEGDGFFWIRYDDFDKFSTSAVELVGRRDSAAPGGVIAGRLRFEEPSGTAMAAAQGQGRVYQLARAYPSGTEFRVVIGSDGPAYVYLLASDLTWQLDRVFPDTDDSPYLAYHDNHIAIPAGTTYLRLDDRPGTDSFLALYSLRKLDFPTLLQRMQAASGDLLARLRAVLVQDLVPEGEVRYAAADDIAFSAPTTTGTVVAIIVEIHHVQ